MYKKGGGKYRCHSWTKECQNMGMFSYIVVQLWCQSLGQRCQFKTIHGPSSLCPHPFHFIHLCITHWFCLKKRTQHDIPWQGSPWTLSQDVAHTAWHGQPHPAICRDCSIWVDEVWEGWHRPMQLVSGWDPKICVCLLQILSQRTKYVNFPAATRPSSTLTIYLILSPFLPFTSTLHCCAAWSAANKV